MRHCTKSHNVSCHGFVCCFLQQQHFHSLQRSFNPIQFGLFGPFTCNRLTSIKLTINVRNCFWNSPDVKPAAEAIAVKNIFLSRKLWLLGRFPSTYSLPPTPSRATTPKGSMLWSPESAPPGAALGLQPYGSKPAGVRTRTFGKNVMDMAIHRKIINIESWRGLLLRELFLLTNAWLKTFLRKCPPPNMASWDWHVSFWSSQLALFSALPQKYAILKMNVKSTVLR